MAVSEQVGGVSHVAVPALGRVVSTEGAASLSAAYRAAGLRVVCTDGCFDLLHRGHLHCLEVARSFGDVLVVGLNGDDSVRRRKGDARPLHPVADRAAVLAALRCVDYVAVFDDDTAVELVERLRPHVYVRGEGHAEGELPEAEAARRVGAEVHLVGRLPGRSTSSLFDLLRADSPLTPG